MRSDPSFGRRAEASKSGRPRAKPVKKPWVQVPVPVTETDVDAAMLPSQTAEPCQVHGSHRPHTEVNERHHIWPLGHGGPNKAANLVVVCATGHNNIHRLLDLLIAGKGAVAMSELRRYTLAERDLARRGYDCIVRGSL